MPRLIGRMVRRSGLMVVIGLLVAGVGIWGIARLPTAFIPNDDQGYLMIVVAVARRRRRSAARPRRSNRRPSSRSETPGVQQVIAISGLSVARQFRRPRQCRRLLCRAEAVGRAAEGQGTGPPDDLPSACRRGSATLPDGQAYRAAAAADPGHRQCRRLPDAGRAARRQLRLSEAERSHPADRQGGGERSQLQHVLTTFSPGAPQVSVTVDRARAETLRVSVGDVFSTLTAYLGSTYVNQFNKFGQSFQVYVQADSQFRLQPGRSAEPLCAQPGQPDGADRRGRASRVRRSRRR